MPLPRRRPAPPCSRGWGCGSGWASPGPGAPFRSAPPSAGGPGRGLGRLGGAGSRGGHGAGRLPGSAGRWRGGRDGRRRAGRLADHPAGRSAPRGGRPGGRRRPLGPGRGPRRRRGGRAGPGLQRHDPGPGQRRAQLAPGRAGGGLARGGPAAGARDQEPAHPHRHERGDPARRTGAPAAPTSRDLRRGDPRHRRGGPAAQADRGRVQPVRPAARAGAGAALARGADLARCWRSSRRRRACRRARDRAGPAAGLGRPRPGPPGAAQPVPERARRHAARRGPARLGPRRGRRGGPLGGRHRPGVAPEDLPRLFEPYFTGRRAAPAWAWPSPTASPRSTAVAWRRPPRRAPAPPSRSGSPPHRRGPRRPAENQATRRTPGMESPVHAPTRARFSSHPFPGPGRGRTISERASPSARPCRP